MEVQNNGAKVNNGNRAQNSGIAENEELKQEFLRVFNTENDFDMPLDLAWSKFQRIVETGQIDITPNDTEKIVGLCISVKIDYYKNDRGLIVDTNGNPDIKANLEANKEFLEENPDIKKVAEEKLTETELRNLMQEKSIEKFIDKYLELNETQKTQFINENILKYQKEEEKPEEKQELVVIASKIIEGIELTEEETNKYQEALITKLVKGIKFSEGLSQEEQIKEKAHNLRTAIVLYESGSPENMNLAIAIMGKYMPPDEIALFKTNILEAKAKALAHYNSTINGSDKSFADVIKSVGFNNAKEIVEQQQNLEMQDTGVIKEKTQEVQQVSYRLGHIEFENNLEKKIYTQLKKVDFRKDENALMLLKLYTELKNSNYTFITEIGEQKKEAYLHVLETVIFADKNAGRFGNYIDHDENGKLILNEEKINEDAEAYKDEFAIVLTSTKDFLNSRDAFIGFDSIKNGFLRAEDVRAKKIDKSQIIEEYISLYDSFIHEEDYIKKTELEERLANLERTMARFKEFSSFFKKGRVNPEEVRRYYEQMQQVPEYNDELRTAMIEFARVDVVTSKKETSKEDEKREILKTKHGIDESFDEYNQRYEDYSRKYTLNNAFNTVYSSYLNGKTLDTMNMEAEKKKYMEALGYLYLSGNPSARSFAEKFIRYNFQSVVLDENGNIDENKFRKVFQSYQIGEHNKNLRNVVELYERRTKLHLAKELKGRDEYNFSELDYEIDFDAINNSLGEISRRDDELEFIYTDTERAIIDKICGSVDLKNPRDIMSLVAIRNAIQTNLEASEEQKALADVINKFATFSQNRIYFQRYLNGNNIQTSFSGSINIEIAQALGYDLTPKVVVGEEVHTVEMAPSKVSKISQGKKEQIGISKILSYIIKNSDDIDAINAAIEREGLEDSAVLKLFKDKNGLDIQKIKAFKEILGKKIEHEKNRKAFVSKMVEVLSDSESLNRYIDNPEQFFEDARSMITEAHKENEQESRKRVNENKFIKKEEQPVADEELESKASMVDIVVESSELENTTSEAGTLVADAVVDDLMQTNGVEILAETPGDNNVVAVNIDDGLVAEAVPQIDEKKGENNQFDTIEAAIATGENIVEEHLNASETDLMPMKNNILTAIVNRIKEIIDRIRNIGVKDSTNEKKSLVQAIKEFFTKKEEIGRGNQDKIMQDQGTGEMDKKDDVDYLNGGLIGTGVEKRALEAMSQGKATSVDGQIVAADDPSIE